jgi:arylsulfatase A-like enzyme
MSERKSLLLVTVDCLRADHCGFMGYPRPTTPFLDALAAESFVFPTAMVAGVPTYYSFPAILASRYPLALGREVVGLAVRESNLASTFHDDGYATAFFGAANPYLSPQFGYDFGFDTFCDFLDHDVAPASNAVDESAHATVTGNLNRALAGVAHKIPLLRAVYDEVYFQYCQRWASAQSFDQLRRFPAADVIVDHAQSWLASVAERPFFLWLHFMDPHAPYYPTEKALEMLGESLTPDRTSYLNESWNRSDIAIRRLRRYRRDAITLYDAGIRWADTQLSRLAETLRRTGLWENCILAFTADHGEEFLDHNGRYHPPSLSEELIHVPLMVRVPEATKREVSKEPFSLLHLAPTLLDAAGSPIPADFQGVSHWVKIKTGGSWSESAIAECIAGCTNPFRADRLRASRLLAIREAKYKLVLKFDTYSEDFFDLEADPMERSPLPDHIAKPERRRLLEAAVAHLKQSSHPRDSESFLRTRLREFALHPSNAATSARTHAATGRVG